MHSLDLMIHEMCGMLVRSAAELQKMRQVVSSLQRQEQAHQILVRALEELGALQKKADQEDQERKGSAPPASEKQPAQELLEKLREQLKERPPVQKPIGPTLLLGGEEIVVEVIAWRGGQIVVKNPVEKQLYVGNGRFLGPHDRELTFTHRSNGNWALMGEHHTTGLQLLRMREYASQIVWPKCQKCQEVPASTEVVNGKCPRCGSYL